MATESPPIQDVLIEQNGLPRIPWILFFSSLFEGDEGTSFSPNFVSLTTVGTPTITGRYYRINQRVCLFFISIVPATSTSSTGATTYVDNFPLRFVNDSVCLVSTGSGAVQGIGGIRASDNRIYPPSWTAATQPLTIVGLGITS